MKDRMINFRFGHKETDYKVKILKYMQGQKNKKRKTKKLAPNLSSADRSAEREFLRVFAEVTSFR